MAENMKKPSKVDQPDLKKHDIKTLDLAFAMDCTGSMQSYIDSATDNIRKIVEQIVASEKSDVRLALVEYRDHPPEDSSFVTKVHDFTASPSTMKSWLQQCSASGGGDEPEAVADALHDILKLSWRDEATKICVCISDAPPHGLGGSVDGFPNGCPAGIDPMVVIRQLAEKGVTLYMVGCEPSISPFKDFFMALAHITGGQYVPLTKAQLLTQVIVGGAQEEMSLEQFMNEVDEEVQTEMAAGRAIDEDEITRRVHSKMASKGIRTKQLQWNKAELESVDSNVSAKKLSNLATLGEVRKEFRPTPGDTLGSLFCDLDRSVPMRSAPMPLGEPPVMNMAMGAPPPPPPPMGAPMALGAPSMMNMAMGATPPPPPMGAPMARLAPAPRGALMGSMADDSYETVEAEISYAQSNRMVQKSIARNMAKKK